MERAKGIEPMSEAWRAPVLPLNYARSMLILAIEVHWKNSPFGQFRQYFSTSVILADLNARPKVLSLELRSVPYLPFRMPVA